MNKSKLLIRDKFNEHIVKNFNTEKNRREKLFNFWLENFFILFSENNLPEYKCINLEEWYLKKQNINTVDNSFSFKKLLKKIISYLPKSKKLFLYYNSENISFFNDIKIISLREKLKRTKFKLDKDSRSKFLFDIKQTIPEEIYLSLLKVMPDFFFYENLSKNFLPDEIHLALGHIMEHPWNLFSLSDMPLKIIGYQHGGNYGEFNKNLYQEFEESYCDEFILWGIGNKNIKQQRFKEYKNNNLIINNFFILDSYSSIFAQNHIDGFSQINQDLEYLNPFRKIKYEFKMINHFVHPKSKPKKNKNNYFLDKMSSNELKKSLIIIPYSGSTVLYRCIYEDIPFVLYFNKEWKKYFSKNYLHFLNFLEGQNKVFWWSQEEELIKFLKEKLSSNTADKDLSNANIKDYLEKKF